jgi:hypothetical protein
MLKPYVIKYLIKKSRNSKVLKSVMSFLARYVTKMAIHLILPMEHGSISVKYVQEKHWCKASKGVQARNAAGADELVDIW